MNIIIYSHFFLPVAGGVQTNVFELASGLTEWRVKDSGGDCLEVTVVTRTAETVPEEDLWPFHVVRRPTFSQLVRLIRGADVVHVAGPAMLPMAIGLALRKPVLIEHHGYQAMCPNGLLLIGTDRSVCPGHFLARRYGQCIRCNSDSMGWFGSLRNFALQFPRRWLCVLASANIAITDHVARRIALPRTQTILYGIRDPGCGPSPQIGNSAEIGYVGRLVYEKGLPILLKAAKLLQDGGFSFHLTFVGGGPLRQQLEDESRELGLAPRVTFTGELAGAELDRAVRPLTIAVMPSVWEETAGLAAIEQMMRGKVVIASDIGGLSEVVGEAGLKFTPGDSDALYKCLRQVLQDPALAAALGSSARDRSKNFGRHTMVQRHVSLYRKVAQ